MPSPPTGPLAVDLDVLKAGDTTDPVTLDDVERALYALTGWQKPQRLVDQALDVVVAFARQVRAGRVVPQRDGHLVVACKREHLDEHLCPITVKTAKLPATDGNAPCLAPDGCTTLDGCVRGCRWAADELSRLGQEMADTAELEPTVTAADIAAAVEAVRGEVTAAFSRSARGPAMTVEHLMDDGLDEATLTPPQRHARAVLLAGRQQCTDCGETKALNAFYRDKAKLTGRMGKCADCSNKAAAARRSRRKDPPESPL